jgi:hypothetical protein
VSCEPVSYTLGKMSLAPIQLEGWTFIADSAIVNLQRVAPMHLFHRPDAICYWSPINQAVRNTIRAYLNAARDLISGPYAHQKDLAPPHMRLPCNALVALCADGMIVRYDQARGPSPQITIARFGERLEQIAPSISDGFVHFPGDPSTYDLSSRGMEVSISSENKETVGKDKNLIRFAFVGQKPPKEFTHPAPPSRPISLAYVTNEHGHELVFGLPHEIERSLLDARFRLPVGWETIQVFLPPDIESWRPEYAEIWAQLDLLNCMAQNNARESYLRGLDSREEVRRKYAGILAEFSSLLAGPEEPAHQFLKRHPELLSPTHENYWSKLPFGDRVSDFVFREAHNDYLLVELEAPHRELFRKDGQQREELTHAINQVIDWIQYIADNKDRVEQELGLTGISTNPRTLVVIGRSESLTEENRRKIVSLQALQNKLRILTYDDVILNARAHLQNVLGPIPDSRDEGRWYHYRESEKSKA